MQNLSTPCMPTDRVTELDGQPLCFALTKPSPTASPNLCRCSCCLGLGTALLSSQAEREAGMLLRSSAGAAVSLLLSNCSSDQQGGTRHGEEMEGLYCLPLTGSASCTIFEAQHLPTERLWFLVKGVTSGTGSVFRKRLSYMSSSHKGSRYSPSASSALLILNSVTSAPPSPLTHAD